MRVSAINNSLQLIAKKRTALQTVNVKGNSSQKTIEVTALHACLNFCVHPEHLNQCLKHVIVVTGSCTIMKINSRNRSFIVGPYSVLLIPSWQILPFAKGKLFWKNYGGLLWWPPSENDSMPGSLSKSMHLYYIVAFLSFGCRDLYVLLQEVCKKPNWDKPSTHWLWRAGV